MKCSDIRPCGRCVKSHLECIAIDEVTPSTKTNLHLLENPVSLLHPSTLISTNFVEPNSLSMSSYNYGELNENWKWLFDGNIGDVDDWTMFTDELDITPQIQQKPDSSMLADAMLLLQQNPTSQSAITQTTSEQPEHPQQRLSKNGWLTTYDPIAEEIYPEPDARKLTNASLNVTDIARGRNIDRSNLFLSDFDWESVSKELWNLMVGGYHEAVNSILKFRVASKISHQRSSLRT